MTLEEAFIITERKNSYNHRENKKYYKHKNYWEEGNPEFTAGRERLVSAIVNKLNKDGIFIERSTVRKYLIKQREVWNSNDRPTWMDNVEKKSRKEGYSFDSTKENNKGRAYMYTCLINAGYWHFKKENK